MQLGMVFKTRLGSLRPYPYIRNDRHQVPPYAQESGRSAEFPVGENRGACWGKGSHLNSAQPVSSRPAVLLGELRT